MSNIQVDGVMGYECKYCGYKVLMFLDSRLKLGSTRDNESWQPVPFGIICPHCGRSELYHTKGSQVFEPMDLKANMNYFEYDDSGTKMACGRPKGKDFRTLNIMLESLRNFYGGIPNTKRLKYEARQNNETIISTNMIEEELKNGSK